MTYDDYPACLPRYAWLLEGGQAFGCGYCKACGDPVAPQNEKAHLRGHRAELAKVRAKARRQSTARLKAITRIRKENRV